MKSEIENEPCTVQDLKQKSDLGKWIESLGGKTRVAKILGIDPSSLWRYEVGQEATPKWLSLLMNFSKEMAEIKSLNRKLKRENERLKSLNRTLQEENERLKSK